MWKKDNKTWGGDPIIVGNFLVVAPKAEHLRAAGYVWEDPPVVEPVTPVEMPKRYSTLKIIRQLGIEWETYRKKLETAGVLDQFFAANYLSADDPVFISFIADVPEALLAQLEDCLWDPA